MKGFVAIVGRPNVGKSTLFNRLIGERKAIVDDMPALQEIETMVHASGQGVNLRSLIQVATCLILLIFLKKQSVNK